MSNSKETMTKKQQDDLASTFNNLPWSLPLGFPSMPAFGTFPAFGLPTPNFPALNSLVPPTTSGFPTSTPSLSSTDPTTDVWSNGLSTSAASMDYNEYVKQFGLLMNAFKEQPKPSENDASKSSSTTKTSKSKRTTPVNHTPPPSSSSGTINGKNSRSKLLDESHPRPTSTSSSSTSSQRSSSKNNPTTKSSTSSSTRSKPMQTSTSTKSSTVPDATTFDPLAFAAASTAGLPFPYFLPSLLSQTSTNSSTTTTNPTTPYPFSSLPSSLMNPAASLYPFLSPDWFTSPSKFMDGFGNLSSTKSNDSKESTSYQPSKSKQSAKPITTSENKHLPSLNSLLNESPSSSKSKKRAKSIRALTEEQEEKITSNNQTRKSSAIITNPSLLHSVLSDSNNGNGVREHSLNLSQSSGIADTTPLIQSADESRSNDDDDSDLNPKRRKTEEVNEALVGIPLTRGWKRVTIVRAITRTGVRGDVSYFAPCGRKLRSFQEIDRYLSKKNITDLDRSHFTFSSKVHIGHFHEPKEGPDGKTIFQEYTEDEIINRILEINPKFRRVKYDHDSETSTKTSTVSSPSITPSHNNGVDDHHHQHPLPSQDLIQHMYDESRKLRLEQEELTKRSTGTKSKRDPMRLLRNITGESSKTSERLPNPSFVHNDFLQAILEQQKQEFEHQQKLQQEQQEQERKRQELAYLKQLEIKKRQEEKLALIEQRKAEKNAEREKKIQEKYMEMVLAKEAKRIAEDMQLRDLKPLPTLKPVETNRLSIEAFANCLMIIQFLTNFKDILQIPEHLIPSLNTFQQSSSRDLNTLCQLLLNIALDDPGIPNPKKGLTSLGQKLSEIDITEHTFSEILRIYIRERNGFDDKLTQTLSDTSFQSLSIDEKTEIIAFLCNDLSANKRIVEEVDRNIDELTILKHEKLELEKRLRRLKFERSSNAKKMMTLVRDKELNSSDNESPDESEAESTKNEDESTMTQDPAADLADDQDIENIDETKIDDLDKRLTLITRKYTLMKRRVIEKHCRTRVLHLGQDRYRRRYWYFSHLPGIYVEGLTSGDISLDDIRETVENVTKQKLDKTGDIPPVTSRSTQRKKQQIKSVNPPTPPRSSTPSIEPLIPMENNKINADNEEESISVQQESQPPTNLTTMDLSAFCTNTIDESTTIKTEPSEEMNNHTNKRELPETIDDDLPLDLSCSKPKRSCEENYWTSQPMKSTSSSFPEKKLDQFQELNDLATTAILLSDIKQENILGLTSAHFSSSIKQEPSVNHYKQIEQSIREKFQYPQPLPIPEDMQSGWWFIQTSDELRTLMKSLAKRGQRERYLCRMLQRYFDVITQSNMKSDASPPPPSTETQADNDHDEHSSNPSNGLLEHESTNSDDRHEMDILNEIYNLSDRIIFSSLYCRSFDTNISRIRLTYSDIQTKGSDILDEAKHLLTEIERNIERRYLKHPFVRKYEMNVPSLNRINQNTSEDSNNEILSSKSDEVPQQLERWRRTVLESRTPAQLALCLTQLERCIAWERSITRVFCEICNSDNDEEKLLLCDGCDHGTHTFCLRPSMLSIPPNDWYCNVCIGKAKGENLCFVCGNKGEQQFNRCEPCGKYFHEDCLKNAKQQRGKWFCVLCAANEPTMGNNGNATMKSSTGRQTSRSMNSRQPPTNSISSNTNVESISSSKNRSRSNNNRKSKSTSEPPQNQDSRSNSSHADTSTPNDLLPTDTNDIDSEPTSPSLETPKKKSSKKSKVNTDVKSCKIILNELLKSDVSWPFHNPVDAKQHPEYYECVNHPMDFSIIKKKMRNHRYTKREEFLHDVELILNNCEYFNEDDSPVGEAGHLLRTFFQSQWTKQFG